MPIGKFHRTLFNKPKISKRPLSLPVSSVTPMILAPQRLACTAGLRIDELEKTVENLAEQVEALEAKIARPASDGSASQDNSRLLSIAEFCARYRMGRSQFHSLQRAGQGPVKTKIGGRVFITEAAAAIWQRRMEAGSEPTSEDNKAS